MNKRTFLFFLASSLASGAFLKACVQPASNVIPGLNRLGLPFNDFFEDGFSFQFTYKDGEPPESAKPQTVRIAVHNIGELAMPSGILFACDPLLEPDLDFHFAQSIPVGRYPVFLSVADFVPRNDQRVAYAMLRISVNPMTKWKIAKVKAQNPTRADRFGYRVDSGTGCFMDKEVTVELKQLANPNPDEYEKARQISSEAMWALTRNASERFEREYSDRVIREFENNGSHNLVASWANIQVNNQTDANVIAFSAEWGDGEYQSYWGYDAPGAIAALVTGFSLFETYMLI